MPELAGRAVLGTAAGHGRLSRRDRGSLLAC